MNSVIFVQNYQALLAHQSALDSLLHFHLYGKGHPREHRGRFSVFFSLDRFFFVREGWSPPGCWFLLENRWILPEIKAKPALHRQHREPSPVFCQRFTGNTRNSLCCCLQTVVLTRRRPYPTRHA